MPLNDDVSQLAEALRSRTMDSSCRPVDPRTAGTRIVVSILNTNSRNGNRIRLSLQSYTKNAKKMGRFIVEMSLLLGCIFRVPVNPGLGRLQLAQSYQSCFCLRWCHIATVKALGEKGLYVCFIGICVIKQLLAREFGSRALPVACSKLIFNICTQLYQPVLEYPVSSNVLITF